MSMYEIPGIRYFYYYLMIGLMTAIFLLIINHNLKGITCCLLMIIALLSSFLMWVALASEYLPFRVWLAVPVICGFTYFFTLQHQQFPCSKTYPTKQDTNNQRNNKRNNNCPFFTAHSRTPSSSHPFFLNLPVL